MFEPLRLYYIFYKPDVHQGALLRPNTFLSRRQCFRIRSLFKELQFVLKRARRIWKRLFPEWKYFGTITEPSFMERLKELKESLFLHSNGK